MVKDIIDGIKGTEAEAAGIVEKARKEKAGLIAKAKDDARKMIEAAEAGGKDIVKQALGRAREEAAAKVEEIAAREAKDLETVRREASGRIDQAVEIIIKKMTG
jgi:vacuolar-type H+-ATPase subunit H